MDVKKYPDEETYLARTVRFIDEQIRKIEARSPAKAAYIGAATELERIDQEALKRYQRARPEPYFARVDMSLNDEGGDLKAYLGELPVEKHVYSWTSPVAKLFHAIPGTDNSYEAPEGLVKGKITLKRRYQIRQATLQGVSEVYRLAPPAEGVAQIEAPPAPEYLIERLSTTNRGRTLRKAIATIEPEQYEQIAAAPEQIMLVQGVAGSGKSLVGLHRVAYLLSPFNEREDTQGIDGSRVVFFGPTKAFLMYIEDLLPSVDILTVPQLTVFDWLRSTLSKQRVHLDSGEELLVRLLRDRGKKLQADHEVAKFKGSMRMAQILERYVEQLRKKFIKSATAVAVRASSPTPVVLDHARVRRELKSLSHEPINSARTTAIDRLADVLWRASGQRDDRLTSRQLRSTRRGFIERIRPQLDEQFSAFWPVLDFRQEYRRLTSDSTLLREMLPGKSQAPTLLARSENQRPNVFRREDIGALCYLDHLINDRIETDKLFHHVVLDEAQEISPIELLIIKQHTRGNGFTILGDLTQSLSPQGIDRWQEAISLFRPAKVSESVARTSYRATREITRFANRVLKRVAPRAMTAIPFDRTGESVKFNRSRDHKQMVAAVVADITQLSERGAISIGVLCKTGADAKRVHDALRGSGVTAIGLMRRGENPQTNVVVAPVSMTRGLEYDAVILTGASKDNFPPTPLHGRILYLAVTRAADYLSIHWFGQAASQLPIRVAPRRRKPSKNTRKKRARRTMRGNVNRAPAP